MQCIAIELTTINKSGMRFEIILMRNSNKHEENKMVLNVIKTTALEMAKVLFALASVKMFIEV